MCRSVVPQRLFRCTLCYRRRHGEVGDVYIPRDHYTQVHPDLFWRTQTAHCPLIVTILCKQASRGYAFVRFINKQDAEDALEKLQDYVMEGRELRIAFAQKR